MGSGWGDGRWEETVGRRASLCLAVNVGSAHRLEGARDAGGWRSSRWLQRIRGARTTHADRSTGTDRSSRASMRESSPRCDAAAALPRPRRRWGWSDKAGPRNGCMRIMCLGWLLPPLGLPLPPLLLDSKRSLPSSAILPASGDLPKHPRSHLPVSHSTTAAEPQQQQPAYPPPQTIHRIHYQPC